MHNRYVVMDPPCDTMRQWVLRRDVLAVCNQVGQTVRVMFVIYCMYACCMAEFLAACIAVFVNGLYMYGAFRSFVGYDYACLLSGV